MTKQQIGVVSGVGGAGLAAATLQAVKRALEIGAEPDSLRVEVVPHELGDTVRVTGEGETSGAGWREAQQTLYRTRADLQRLAVRLEELSRRLLPDEIQNRLQLETYARQLWDLGRMK